MNLLPSVNYEHFFTVSFDMSHANFVLFQVALTCELTVMGACICSTSGEAFTRHWLITIGFYCYNQCIREG